MAGLHVRTYVVLAYTAAGILYGVAAVLLAGIRINVDPAFGSAYLLAPIAAVVIAGASFSGGLASATSTWMAALALTMLTQMLLILGLSAAMQFVVFGPRSSSECSSPATGSHRCSAACCGRSRRHLQSRWNERQHELRLTRKGGTMHGMKGSAARSRRPMMTALVLALLVAALVVVSSSLGSTGQKRSAHATPLVIGKGGGFGEVYAAKASTLKKTLFKATLLPKDPTARNIALAGLGRADRKVNYDLALQCWKNNGCDTGTGGKLKVAYIEQFGENTYREMSKMEFILQALTYPAVGKIIYSSAHSDFTKAFADWKAAIAQKVDLIVTYPDFGDAMIPVMKEATDAGIPVATYAWGYVTGPGTNYLTVVGEDTCALGKTYAYVMNTQVKSGNIAFLGGFPGNPLSAGWQKCERAALKPNIHVVATEPTNWDPSKVQQVVAGILAKYPDIKGWSYEYGGAMATGAVAAYKAAGIPVQHRADAQDGRRHHGLYVQRDEEPEPQDVLLHLGEHADPDRLHGGDDEAQGGDDSACRSCFRSSCRTRRCATRASRAIRSRPLRRRSSR